MTEEPLRVTHLCRCGRTHYLHPGHYICSCGERFVLTPEPGTKAMTMRLDPELAAAVGLVAKVDGVSVSAEVRDALAAHIQRRRADPEWQERLRRILTDNSEALGKLRHSYGVEPVPAPAPGGGPDA